MKQVAALGMGSALVVVGLSACSSTPGYCEQLDVTRTAFDEVVGTNVIAEGTDTLQIRFDAFQAEVEQLAEAASAEFAEESAAVEAATDQMDQVLDDAVNLNLGAAAQQVGPALSALTTSVNALFDAVGSACE